MAIDLRDGVEAVMDSVEALGGGLLLSIVSRVELEGGALREPTQAARLRQRLDALLSGFSILAFDDACADAYRAIIEATGYSRHKILDRVIAAQAIVHARRWSPPTPTISAMCRGWSCCSGENQLAMNFLPPLLGRVASSAARRRVGSADAERFF